MKLKSLNDLAPELINDILENAEVSEFTNKLKEMGQLMSYGPCPYDDFADAFTIDVDCIDKKEYVHSEWVTLKNGSALVDFDSSNQILGIQVLNGKHYYKKIVSRST